MPNVRAAIYDTVIAEVFCRLRDKYSKANDNFDFDKSMIEAVTLELRKQRKIAKGIKNIADIKYTYDARADFPKPICSSGHWAILGRGKSLYRFVRLPQNNLIRVPADLPTKPTIMIAPDSTPSLVQKVLGKDEQATLTRVTYNRLIGVSLGCEVFWSQGHERTTISAGQIEVDAVFVGHDSGGEYVIPISAKGGDGDCLSYTQALNLNLYAAEKPRYRGMICRPMGLCRTEDDHIYLIEFTRTTDIRKIGVKKTWCYRLQ